MDQPRRVVDGGTSLVRWRTGGRGSTVHVPAAVAVAAAALALAGAMLGQLAAGAASDEVMTLRVHGFNVVSNPNEGATGNRRASPGSNTVTDPNTGLIPEDAPYTDPAGPFDPQSAEAPPGDFVTWNPAWISERLDAPALRAQWPGLRGMDEVSRGAHIRASDVNASQKVWLRHWYEPQRLDKDLNADGRLTDADNDGVPDAPVNPTPNALDEWYPAIMVELTYMLVDNDPLPQAEPGGSTVHRSAPRPACGAAGGTQIVFPVGVMPDQLSPFGPLAGHGLTSLDMDLDGEPDMVHVTDEASLPAVLGGARLDFDGDGVLSGMNPDGAPLSCDEMIVLHGDAVAVPRGGRLQFLDYFLEVETLTDSAAVVGVWRNADLLPSRIQRKSMGIGTVIVAGESGPVLELPPGGTNLGTVPIGAWFAYLADVDVDDDEAVLLVGRALGAPCASMESAPNVPNRSAGGPWFLKRFYVDGHEYNVVAIGTCGRDAFQYLTLRTPLPKVPAIIEQHSVRLQGYPLPEQGVPPALPLPPPFNHEHTILEDVAALDGLAPLQAAPDQPLPVVPRPRTLYMGGPVGPIPPVLAVADPIPYTGRYASIPVGPHDDVRAMRWTYVDQTRDPLMLGVVREKLGAWNGSEPASGPGQGAWFYNEQVWTLPWHYTEFLMPDRADDPSARPTWNADRVHVTSAFTAPTAWWRRWAMPDGPMPGTVPPTPPDLIADQSPEGGAPFGVERRGVFWFDPDLPQEGPVKLWLDADGVRLFGGQPGGVGPDCHPDRPALLAGAGDSRVAYDRTSEAAGGGAPYPVEVLPYTDPWALFNPQHPHAPRSDSLTANPAYMDEFRNHNERLRALYRLLSADNQNAREKVYHRLWYEPDYTSKIRFADDCSMDLRFPALVQEFTYLYLDTTDNPWSTPPGRGRFAFPIGTRADELPMPLPGGTLPAGGAFGYGLTTFDANFDGVDEAVTVHSERTLAAYMDTQWQANRPDLPGFPPPALPGPRLDFDGDGVLDDLDGDGLPLTGDEMVVFVVEELTLDLDPATPEQASAMVLDHLVTLENVTRGARAQVRFWFTGGGASQARPQAVGGVHSLQIGEAALVDRFQSKVTVVGPGQNNPGVDGAWFVFLNDVARAHDRVTITVGRALGASHSAIDDGSGNHDLLPGDPWYLKRFYVDGHEYDVVALLTVPGTPGAGPRFQGITIRTPVPKGDVFNPQDSLFLQGYFLDGGPALVSVMPPFQEDHTIAEDISRLEETAFANSRQRESCVGRLRPFGPLEVRIVAEEAEPRLSTELRELLDPRRSGRGWQTDQTVMVPNHFTDVTLSEGQLYLYTSNWRSSASRLSFYGCLRAERPPFPRYVPDLTHEQLAALASGWSPPAPEDIVPAPNQHYPPQPAPGPAQPPGEPPVVSEYFDAALGGPDVRVKLFYDPAERGVDIYINRRPGPDLIATPTATASATFTAGPSPTASQTASPGPSPTASQTASPGPSPTASQTASPGPSPTASVTQPPTAVPTATRTPTPPAFQPVCKVVLEDPLDLFWVDATTFETEFQVEVSVNGSPFIPYTTVRSNTTHSTGTRYLVATGSVPYDTDYRFRVRAVNRDTGHKSSFSHPSNVCRTPHLPPKQSACFSGKVSLQGRSDHSGAAVYYHGFPVAITDRSGSFRFCGVPAGKHPIRSRATCYLEAELSHAWAAGGATVGLPYTALRGGDINNDARVDLFDLVRVGADYRSEPPNDPEADCNADGRVDLFDLVMVSGNYGLHGPTVWGDDLKRVRSLPEGAPPAVDFSNPGVALQGKPAGAPVALGQVRTVAETLVVPITVRGMEGLYGVDVTLAYDPRRVAPVDGQPDRPGLQLAVGREWESPQAFVVRNAVDQDAGRVYFAASRLKPAAPVRGDVVLAEFEFRALGDDTEGAVLLAGAELSDVRGRSLPARWEGLDLLRLVRLFLPRVVAGQPEG